MRVVQQETLGAMIRLALLDDHPVVLAGLMRLVEHTRGMEVLAAARDEVTLARELGGRRPDVLILDYDVARGDALAVCRRIKRRPDPVRVLIYSAYAGPALAIAARLAQADGLVDKTAPATALLDAIRRVAHGQSVMPDIAHEVLVEAVARLDEPDLPILAMLLDGESLPAIAETLNTDEHEIAWRAEKLIGRLRPRFTETNGRIRSSGRA
jgi:DNA-binding NarL/FixJ family response regulator